MSQLRRRGASSVTPLSCANFSTMSCARFGRRSRRSRKWSSRCRARCIWLETGKQYSVFSTQYSVQADNKRSILKGPMDEPESTRPNPAQDGEKHTAAFAGQGQLPGMAEATPDGLRRIVANPGLSEDLALSLLKRGDLPTGVLEELAKNSAAMQSHRVRTRVACHAKTPRHIAIALVRQLYTFELMEVALAPAVLPEIAMAAEQAILMRLEKIACGERVTLARRSSGRLAASLLLDPDPRVLDAALNNPHVTEDVVTKAVLSAKSSAALLELVCHHSKWAVRPEI